MRLNRLKTNMKDIEHKIKLNCYVSLVDWQLIIIQHTNYQWSYGKQNIQYNRQDVKH